MTKYRLIGAVAVLSCVLTVPAMAQHVAAHPAHYAQSNFCATLEPGNPYSKQYDYMAWSAWNSRGGWDSRADDACLRDPHLHHQQASF
jgi:hypothetical protein